jgi:L-alanine-DL-glutamate epimerase-like enolase superfamily enzyme
MSTAPDTITKIEMWPVDLPITDPFMVATGHLLVARNVFVRIQLRSGAVGYGEMAPFPEVGGQDRAGCQRAGTELAKITLGVSASQYGHLADVFQERVPDSAAARCALETAILDALCRHRGIPLWDIWGGLDVRSRETDVTIPITDLDRTVTLAHEWHARGFRQLKMKVGIDVDQDIRRLEAIHRALPDVHFITDANQGYTPDECRIFVKAVEHFGGRIVLLEQPVAKLDLDSMAALRRDLAVPVAADEAVRTVADAKDVIEKLAADFINIKIMKSGVIESVRIASCVRKAGLRLMIGGMVETRLAMGCSFGLVLGLGGFDHLDLDTPLLLSTDPVTGGYRYAGPHLQPWTGPGQHIQSVSGPAKTTDITIIE